MIVFIFLIPDFPGGKDGLFLSKIYTRNLLMRLWYVYLCLPTGIIFELEVSRSSYRIGSRWSAILL